MQNVFDDIEFQNSNELAAENQLFNTSVWYEKYRPKNLDEMILPQYVKDKIKQYLQNNGEKLPHLGLFSRLPGTGKSSLAKVIINELKAESLFINASLDRGIDIIRTRIQSFASQSSLRETVKVVVLDEFDHFSKEGQAAFRGFIDQFSQNVRFIFTGNYKENIIEPLLDRLEIYDFNQFGPSQIAKPILDRLEFILVSEGVQYKREDVLEVIKANFPKIRKMIGDIGAGLTEDESGKRFDYSFIGSSEKLNELVLLLKQKDTSKIKPFCYSLGTIDHSYSFLTEKIEIIFENKTENIINAIIILAKYQDMSTRAKDKNLCLLACVYELLKLL